MKVFVVGSGGREHALAWKIAQSAKVTEVYVAPGNAGTAQEEKMRNVGISAEDIDALLDYAQSQQIDLTVVGPEAPLVAGIVDQFEAAGLACFGPSQAASQLEGSKAFTKEFLTRHAIPTAAYAAFHEVEPALNYIEEQGVPIVIKADGLAAGKGVIVAQQIEEAKAAVIDMLSGNKFGEAGHRVVIEQFLTGEEASFICLVDGDDIIPFASSQDHKAAHDGDTGPNTGGMGAYSPAPVVTAELHQRIMDEVIKPTVAGLAKDGIRYRGFLYAGIMVDPEGNPQVLEYNCRFGDPETQPIMMRLQSDLFELLQAAINGSLSQHAIQFDERVALGVVLAAKGYPGAYAKGDVISSIPAATPESKVFHAGTAFDKESETIKTNGGRVLCATALGETVLEAQTKAYDTVKQVNWDTSTYRTDIGYKAIKRIP